MRVYSTQLKSTHSNRKSRKVQLICYFPFVSFLKSKSTSLIFLYIPTTLTPSQTQTQHKNTLFNINNGFFIQTNPTSQRWTRHRHPNHPQPRFPWDVETLFRTISSHHCSRWWPFKSHQSSWRFRLRALQS